MTDPMEARVGQALEGCVVSMSRHTAGDSGYTNPDGNHVDAPQGTVFVELELSPAAGSLIRVEVSLPPSDRWDGRLVGIGNGGGGGFIPTALGYYLGRGCATTTTDLGTKRNPPQAGFNNPEVWKDFGHRATHLAMAAGKAVASAFYGRPSKFVYFIGGSTGGQQGMSLAQRHPLDCDAIIAAVPAHDRVALHAYFLWNYQTTHRADGSPLFTAEQERGWRKTVLDLFSARETLPRARGCFVSDPRWSDELIEEALRRATANDSSLTPEHIDALRRLCQGPVHAVTGRQLYGGVPPAAAFGPACRNLYLFEWVFGVGCDMMRINLGDDYDRYATALSADLDANGVDLDAFRANGGKLLVYSGTADSCVPWHATAEWYSRLVARYGGDIGAVREFCLYYLLPGREHGGGPGVQLIRDEFKVLMNWREKGITPAPIGHGMVPPAFDLRLEPYDAVPSRPTSRW